MPRCLHVLSLVICGILANTAYSQITLCPGEPVQFELQDPSYYGIKTWEFSPDSIVWTQTTVQENVPFEITQDLVGYYRVRLEDVDCDTTYYSNVVRVVWPQQLQIFTIFTDLIIPATIDPVLWVEDWNAVTDVAYVVNGVSYPATLEFQAVDNPGVNFTVFATAIDGSGCTVYSDTLAFTVEDTNLQGNGEVQLQANVDLNNVMVSSSLESAPLGFNNSFTISYTLDFLYDMIIAHRGNGDSTELVALRMAFTEGDYLLMNERSTALTMVYLHPDIVSLAATNADSLETWLSNRAELISLEGLIQSDLEQLGYILINTPDKATMVNTLVSDILVEWQDEGFRDGGDGMYPILSPGGGEPTLEYYHNNINLVYVARIYKNGQGTSAPIAFRGDGTPTLLPGILNFMAQIFQVNPMMVFRENNSLYLSDIQGLDPLDLVDARLVNGVGIADTDEEIIARKYNDYSWYYKFLAALPLAHIAGLNNAQQCLLDLGLNIIEGYQAGLLVDTEDEWATSLDNLWDITWSTSLGCGANTLLSWFYTSGLVSIGTFQNLGWHVQYFYDRYTRESEVIYSYTTVNNTFRGILMIESNAEETFIGIPGSKTTIDPAIWLREKPIKVRKPSGTILFESDPEPYASGSPFLNTQGFSLSGFMSQTEQVEINGQPYAGLGFVDGMMLNTNNPITWVLSNSASIPSQADLAVQVIINGVNLPNFIEGYENGSINFIASIEQPSLTIISGNGQSGSPNSVLSQPCTVQLQTQSGTPIPYYHLFVQVLQGGGQRFAG